MKEDARTTVARNARMTGRRRFLMQAALAGMAQFLPALPVKAADTRKVVRVGAYYFPPFVAERAGPPTGITAALADLLNRSQKTFRFELVRTTPSDRYADFEAGAFDALLFEEIAWGWGDRQVVASKPYLTGGEVYVARAEPGRTQAYFSDVAKHSIAAIRGYHYGFADFEADPAKLMHRFRIWLGSSHRDNLQRVLDGASDIAVVSISYLRQQLLRHPDWQKSLLVSDKFDQRYAFTVVVRDGVTPSPAWFDKTFAELHEDKALDKLWVRYGLTQQLPEAPAK